MPAFARDKRLSFPATSTPKEVNAHCSSGNARLVLTGEPHQQHGQPLQYRLADLKQIAASAEAVQREQVLESGIGLQIHFVCQPNIELAFQSLADERAGVVARKPHY